ncbi:hypothetical protein MLD38_007999 [Melastoma candidum]|uniref:Uncharacterized protein n=1 Tax=Melastoma candidum TaxID=119954 RepID=A0ACB9RUT7_9MYRT|nr:hypothetical protein MLD38_007999 [Melastoma candidum]
MLRQPYQGTTALWNTTEADILTNFDKDLGIRFSSALDYIVRIGYILHLVLFHYDPQHLDGIQVYRCNTAVSLGFIFPPFVALRFSQKGASLNQAEKLLSWVMLVLAVMVSIVGVIGNIYSLESHSE